MLLLSNIPTSFYNSQSSHSLLYYSTFSKISFILIISRVFLFELSFVLLHFVRNTHVSWRLHEKIAICSIADCKCVHLSLILRRIAVFEETSFVIKNIKGTARNTWILIKPSPVVYYGGSLLRFSLKHLSNTSTLRFLLPKWPCNCNFTLCCPGKTNYLQNCAVFWLNDKGSNWKKKAKLERWFLKVEYSDLSWLDTEC